MNRLKYIVFISILLAITPARTEPKTVHAMVADGWKLVTDRKYSDAISSIQPLLTGLRLTEPQDIILAHKTLGVSYCAQRKFEKAEEHFHALVIFDRTISLNKDVSMTASCRNLWSAIQESAELSYSSSSKP